MKIAGNTLSLLAVSALCACSGQPVKDDTGQDALRNTKKLVSEGHATLYHNGAFEVPMTTIHIIPAGPSAWELAGELAGLRARQSFQESIKHARESAGIAKAGVSKSFEVAAEVNRGTNDIAGGAHEVARFGLRTAAAAPAVGAGVIGASVTYAEGAETDIREAGKSMADGALEAGRNIADDSHEASGKLSRDADQRSAETLANSTALASQTSHASTAAAKRQWSYAAERFVKGYAAVPEKLGQHAHAVGESLSFARFVEAAQRDNQWRASRSGAFADIIVETKSNYAADATKSFAAAKYEITEGSKESGPTLAALKSLRWVVQGIFWDATIKPAGKLAGASLGYLTVNGVVFPVLVTGHGAAAVANVAVQVTWNGAASVYDVTAPTVTSAMAGVFSAVELVGGNAVAAGEVTGGAVAAAGTYGVGKVAAAGTYGVGTVAAGATAGAGYVAGKTVQYVGAPLSSVGIKAGGVAAGVVAGTFTAAGGLGLAAAGGAGEVAAQVTGKTATAAVAAGGSAVSVAAGGALGTYELAKAVVVPAGYEFGAGMVVSYDSLAQLSAQTVLAVSDASYMVLSLEGPRWVLYAVKGNVDKGDNLPAGALLDLNAMQKAGETFYAVPVSNEEMERLITAVPAALPVRAAPPDSAAAAAP